MVLFIAEAGLVGGLLGGVLFGAWMTVTNKLFGWHGNDVFSSQAIADHKCFLRMHLEASGLTIYPLKIAKVCRDWKLGTGARSRPATARPGSCAPAAAAAPASRQRSRSRSN